MLIKSVRIIGTSDVCDIKVESGKISKVTKVKRPAKQVIIPTFGDIHVHLDKTYLIDRCPEPVNSLRDAIKITSQAMVSTTVKDIKVRARRALREGFLHGVCAMRSHVNWHESQPPKAWIALNQLAEEWKGNVELQLASFTPLDLFAEIGEKIAKRVAIDRQVLGAFVLLNENLDRKIKYVFDLAEKYDLSLDFHVDETLDPKARGLDSIITETEKRQMTGRVLCSHCCSLTQRPKNTMIKILERAVAVDIGLVALPSTNLYLQDREFGRTPVLRGLAPIKEANSLGLKTMLASDNCQDPFYPYGNYDTLNILRTGVLNAHLDPDAWIGAITSLPRKWMGLSSGKLEPGEPADFILFAGRNLSEVISQPGLARIVYRNGKPIGAHNNNTSEN